jgi:asparagine synthase (glutamine-hydrolysing)
VTFEQTLPKIVSCLEEPIASSSIVPMYFVCQRARQDVTVALTGQGPDELFGGYRRHLGVRYGAMWGGLPGWMREPIASAISALPRNETLKRGVYALDVPDRLRRYQHVLSILPGDEVDSLFQDGVLDPEAGDSILNSWNDLTPLMEGTDELGGLQYIELRSTLPDELLMYSDKLSMAHSLELRVPYLDKEVVEYAERLPARFKIRNSSRKWIHRQVCSSFLPRPLLKRKKRGFAVNVVDAWFQDARGNMDDIFTDPSSLMYEYLKPETVQSLLAQHRSRQSDNHKMLFSLVVFEEWLRLQRGSPRRALAAC